MTRRTVIARIAEWALGPPVLSEVELQNRLQNRTTAPSGTPSVQLVENTLRQMVDRQFDSVESADRKAGILLTALLGLGLLSADALRAPQEGWPLVVFWIGAASGLLAVISLLSVLRSRTLLHGPDAVPTAEATNWKPLPLRQSVADSFAISVAVNQGVLARKSQRLNHSFTLATIAVFAIFFTGVAGIGQSEEDPVEENAPPTASESPSAPESTAAPDSPSAEPSAVEPSFEPTQSGAYEHPPLGVAELREAWDPSTPSPQPPTPPQGEDG